MARLSDDEAVAKMGHPEIVAILDVGHTPSGIVIEFTIWDSQFSPEELHESLCELVWFFEPKSRLRIAGLDSLRSSVCSSLCFF